MRSRVEIRDGTVLTFDVLRWDEGWDFDCPVCILRPIVRFSPNGECADQIVEDAAIDAALAGFVLGEDATDGLVDRQFPLRSLQRRWAAAHRGVAFPVKQYTASRFSVRFYNAADGLAFDVKEIAVTKVKKGNRRAALPEETRHG